MKNIFHEIKLKGFCVAVQYSAESFLLFSSSCETDICLSAVHSELPFCHMETVSCVDGSSLLQNSAAVRWSDTACQVMKHQFGVSLKTKKNNPVLLLLLLIYLCHLRRFKWMINLIWISIKTLYWNICICIGRIFLHIVSLMFIGSKFFGAFVFGKNPYLC